MSTHKKNRFGFLNLGNRYIEDRDIPNARLRRESFYEALIDAFETISGPLSFDKVYEDYDVRSGITRFNPGGLFDYCTGYLFYAALRGYQHSIDAINKTDNEWWYVPAAICFVAAGIGWLGRIGLGIALTPIAAITAVPFIRRLITKRHQPVLDSIMQLKGKNESSGDYARGSQREISFGDFLSTYRLSLNELKVKIKTKTYSAPVSRQPLQHEQRDSDKESIDNSSEDDLSVATKAPVNAASHTKPETWGEFGWRVLTTNPFHSAGPNTTQQTTTHHKARHNRSAQSQNVINTITLSFEPPDPESQRYSCTPGWKLLTCFAICCPTVSTIYTVNSAPEQIGNYFRQAGKLTKGYFNPDVIKFTITVKDDDKPQHQLLSDFFKLNVDNMYTKAKHKGYFKVDEDEETLKFRF